MISMIAVVTMVASFTSAAALGPLETVRMALAAQEAAPIERMRMFIERDGIADVYYVDRIRPGRMRVIKNPRQGGPELIVIDGMQWVRAGRDGWQQSRLPAVALATPSLVQILEKGLTNVVERADSDGRRTVEGEVSWSNAVLCTGRLKLRINRRGMPSLIRFNGLCGGKPTRFRQAFSFAGPVTIEAPE